MNHFIIFILSAFLIANSQAADWSNTRISFLSGGGYANPVNNENDIAYDIITLEHVSGWKYGDHFFFTDMMDTNSKDTALYTEWSPRFSLKKIFGLNDKFQGIISDVLVAGQLNIAPGARKTELFGFGLDLNIPGFNFFQFNYYIRDNRALEGQSQQITLVWESTFKVGVPLKFTGFLDYATKEGNNDSGIAEANTLAQPQLVWMLSETFEFGIEQQYWQNKYGIDGLDESVTQVLVNWNL